MSDMDKIYMPSDDVVAREIEGELIIVPISAGIADMEEDIFTLNETGRAIWENLDGKKTLGQIIDELYKEYEEDKNILNEDVLGFVKELVKRRMLIEV